ncbi:MAG: hypothetical protein ABI347_04365 [Nitrososphaera sp.]|jgi:hypothetical protein
MHSDKSGKGMVRSALADFSEADREVILFVLQKDYGIRFDISSASGLKEIERALKNVLGGSAGRVIEKLQAARKVFGQPE